MRVLILNIVLFTFLQTYGQQGDYFMSIQQYPFINYSENNITFPSGKDSFESLYQKLDSIMLYGEGKLNIVHIGGSHIQADIYTHHIRKRLQTLQYDMNGGRGLIFPFTMAKTNNPWNYKVRYTGSWDYCKNTKRDRTSPLGLTGMSVSTNTKSASIRISPNRDTSIHYTFNHVKVYHPATNYILTARDHDSVYYSSYDTTQACSVFELPVSREFELCIELNDSIEDTFTLYGIQLDNDNPGVVYHAIGVNGAKLESYLNCELYEKQMSAVKPDLVIFSIGTNDGNTKYFDSEKYKNEYEQLINRTKAAAPNAKILITVPNDAYYYKRYVNKNTLLLKKEILEIAEENDYGVWDFFTIMGGLNSSQKWYNYDIMRYDRVHFNRKGYLLKGDLFVTAFLRGWEKNLTARSTHYFHNEKLTEHLTPSQIIAE